MNSKKQIISLIAAACFGLQTLIPVQVWAQGVKSATSKENFYLSKDKPAPKVGNIFYSSNKKNELLFKANIWGAVHFPGIHYVSEGTKLLDVISLAGGPVAAATIDEINLSTVENGKPTVKSYAINNTLTGKTEFNPEMKPGDVVFVKQSHTAKNINLWLSIGTFAMSFIALGLIIDDRNNK